MNSREIEVLPTLFYISQIARCNFMRLENLVKREKLTLYIYSQGTYRCFSQAFSKLCYQINTTQTPLILLAHEDSTFCARERSEGPLPLPFHRMRFLLCCVLTRNCSCVVFRPLCSDNMFRVMSRCWNAQAEVCPVDGKRK